MPQNEGCARADSGTDGDRGPAVVRNSHDNYRTTMEEAAPDTYLAWALEYASWLPLEAVAAAGREALQAFPSLAPSAPADGSQPPDVFEVRTMPLQEVPLAPPKVLHSKPFFALLSPWGADGSKSIIVAYMSHLHVDAYSSCRFLQSWAAHFASAPWAAPTYAPERVAMLVADAVSRGAESTGSDSGWVAVHDLPPRDMRTFTMGVPVCVNSLGRRALQPLQQQLRLRHAVDVTCGELRMALVWKAFVAARRLQSDEPTAISWVVNVRGRCSLPEDYFGCGAIMAPRLERTVGEVTDTPLHQLAALVHTAVRRSTTPDSIGACVASVAKTMAAKGPMTLSCLDVFNRAHARINFSDWSPFNLQPVFAGLRPRLVWSSTNWPIGGSVNYHDEFRIGMIREEADVFSSALDKLIAGGSAATEAHVTTEHMHPNEAEYDSPEV